jgi:streptogramin lyase
MALLSLAFPYFSGGFPLSLSRRRTLTLVAALFLAGCGTTGQLPASPGALAGLTLDRQLDRTERGQLEVSLNATEQGRKLLATVADVATYRLTVTGGSLSAPLVKTCAAPSGSNGKVSALFDELEPGTYTVMVEALDAAGQVIGSASQSAEVKKGKCTVVSLHVKLDPTYVDNRHGSVQVQITVEDGDIIERPIAICAPADGFVPLDGNCATPTPSPSVEPAQAFAVGAGYAIDGDAQGFAYQGAGAVIRKIAPTGDVVAEFPVVGAVYGLEVDPFGNVWSTSNAAGFVSKVNPATGEVVNIDVGDPNGLSGVDFDGEGNAYVLHHGIHRVLKISQAGVIVASFPIPGSFGASNEVVVTPNGEMWITSDYHRNFVSRLSPTGEVIGQYGNVNEPYGICADSQGNVWVANRALSTVTKFSPNGDLLGSFDIGHASWDIVADQNDNIWVSPWGGGATGAVKLSNAGEVLGRFAPTEMWLGTDGLGYVWGSGASGVTRVHQ